MAIVQRNVQIKASPQETMALLSDASRWPDWYPGMTEIDIAAPFPEAGGKVVFKVKSAGISMPITETVLDYEPGKLQVLQMDGMLSGRARSEATPDGDGTRRTTTFDYSLPGGVFGKIADALIVRRLNVKSLEEGLQNFKVLVERPKVARRRAGGCRPSRCSYVKAKPLIRPQRCARSCACPSRSRSFAPSSSGIIKERIPGRHSSVGAMPRSYQVRPGIHGPVASDTTRAGQT